ncbi:MAG TPA: Tim44 domain-containing protein, partial [Accumulibacter sp.]|nr:Tim44 domain-containing protein [Accumulibacter sp.]
MKTLSLLTAVVALGLTLAVGDAEAKRLGSGKSSGMQRESVTADRPASPAMAPAAAKAPAAAA